MSYSREYMEESVYMVEEFANAIEQDTQRGGRNYGKSMGRND